MAHEWLGNRTFYKKLAAALGVYAVGSVYLLFALVEYHWRDAVWVFAPKMIAGVAGGMAAFSLFAYFVFLQVDGHFLTPKDAEKNAEKQIIPLP